MDNQYITCLSPICTSFVVINHDSKIALTCAKPGCIKYMHFIDSMGVTSTASFGHMYYNDIEVLKDMVDSSNMKALELFLSKKMSYEKHISELTALATDIATARVQLTTRNHEAYMAGIRADVAKRCNEIASMTENTIDNFMPNSLGVHEQSSAMTLLVGRYRTAGKTYEEFKETCLMLAQDDEGIDDNYISALWTGYNPSDDMNPTTTFRLCS